MRRFAIVCLLGGLTVAAAHAARADAIDGVWCLEPDLHLTINGPTIVTPSGAPLWGDYSRHAFSYVAPAGEPNAGATMQMRLLNEDTMQRRAAPAGNVETWHRCSPPTS